MADTAIEWARKVWNPTTGCDQVSAGCDHCYALTLAGRLKAMGNPRYQSDGDPRTSGPGFGLTLHPDKLEEPFHWRNPELVFVDSMSDLFHPKVPDDFIARVFAVMALAQRHTFQILTKRPPRMASLLSREGFPLQVARAAADLPGRPDAPSGWPLPNVWLGTSVEDQKQARIRIPYLLDTPAAVRFLSCEPLLGPLDLTHLEWSGGDRADPDGTLRWGTWSAFYDSEPRVHWVIVGGESGTHLWREWPDRGLVAPPAEGSRRWTPRPDRTAWVRSLRDQCAAKGVPFFFKQWGGATPKAGGRELDGRTWDGMPPAS